MEVDTTMNSVPSTPVPNKQHLQDQVSNGEQKTDSSQLSPINKQNISPTGKSGPKIVKPVRPNGARVVKPIVKQNTYDISYNDDEFANIDPFQSKPKVGVDSNSDDNNRPINDFNDIENPFQSKKILARSPSPNSRANKSANDTGLAGEIEYTNGYTLENGTPINDEWETHKKRLNPNRKSTMTVNTQLNGQDSNQISPNNQISSTVSSTTDISSASSVSPNHQSHQQQNIQTQQILLSSSSSSSHTTSTSSISSSNKDDLIGTKLNDASSNDFNSKMDTDPFNTPKQVNNKLSMITDRRSTENGDLNNDFNNQFTDTLSSHINNENENVFKQQDFEKLIDFETNTNLPNDVQAINAMNNVIFDSIFSNDTGFYLFYICLVFI